MRTIWATTVLVVMMGATAAACSDGAVTEPDASNDAATEPDARFVPTDSSRGESLTPDDPARLVRGPQSYETLEGKVVDVADGWKDTKRNEVCAPLESTDGRIRCLPLANVAIWRPDRDLIYRYADAECSGSRKAALVPATVKVAPKLMRAPYRSDTTQYEVHAIAKSASRDYYVFDHCVRERDGGPDGATVEIDSGACGQCVRVTAPAGTDVYTTSDELRPSEFGSFTAY